MQMYFKDFSSYNNHTEGAKSFFIRVTTSSGGKNEHHTSSPIPNDPTTREAVLAAIAASTSEYKEPFYLWNNRMMVVIPADSIESILLEFASRD